MIRLIGLLATSALLVGCYSLQPTGGMAPIPGTEVAFDVNDIGRVALGGSMGPEIAQIEGRLLEQANGEYVVSVSTVRLLRGGQQIWSGERVRLKPEYLGTVYEKRFSRGRSIALGAAAAGGVFAFMITRNLLTAGPGDNNGGGVCCDTAQTIRVRP